ncbi:MmgE/PrpD family protein [soil metagenome]
MDGDATHHWKVLAQQHRGLTMRLAEFLAALEPADVPDKTREILRKALVDALGCGLHGLGLPWTKKITAFSKSQGGPREAVLWGTGERVTALNAALATGCAIHAFDFDDHSRAKIHPAAVVVPVIVALAEKCKADGPRMLAAMAAGFEVMNRVSLAANPSPARMRGWHLTGTTGTFAAAAAACVLMRLDASTTASALGLAGTQSAGVWAFTADGAMSKRLHPGKAAQAGIFAAMLAADGFEGPRFILEAEDGSFLHTMSDVPRPGEITRDLGTEWRADGACFKPHACCGSNHGCVDAAIALMHDNDLKVADIDRVIAGVGDVVIRQTGFEYQADTVLNAQMSLQYDVAIGMIDRQALLEQFTPARIKDEAVFALAKRVEIVSDAELDAIYPEIYGGRVTFVLKDGRTLSTCVKYSKGMPENPMDLDDIVRKYRSLANSIVSSEQAERVLAAGLGLFEAGSATALIAALEGITVQ